MTIYSLIPSHTDLCEGLFCKTGNYANDFVVQDLISEGGYPDGISCGMDALMHQIDLRDNFKEFRTDLHCAGRDGMYNDEDKFVVWDKEDITKLRDYLNLALNNI